MAWLLLIRLRRYRSRRPGTWRADLIAVQTEFGIGGIKRRAAVAQRAVSERALVIAEQRVAAQRRPAGPVRDQVALMLIQSADTVFFGRVARNNAVAESQETR